MDPIQNQPPIPYSRYDIDLYALQKAPRYQTTVQPDTTLPKPFGLVPDKKTKKTDKNKKDKDENEAKG